jgi:bacteriocin biosynthesis cyclodehydratase domain-containing protein
MPFTTPAFKRHLYARRPSSGSSPASDPHRAIAFHSGRERGLVLENLDDTQLLLISLLDGQHSFEQIVSHVQQHDSQVTADDINEVLEDMAHYGLIEDTAVELPADLTPEDLERYTSQLRFLSVLDKSGTQKYELQARLKRARVAVLGLGGLGSNVLIGLAAIGVGFLRGVDFDVVETGNLNRQVLYDMDDVGKPKALAAAEQLRRFNSTVHFEPVQKEIEGPSDISELIKDCDLVALCADHPPSISAWMNHAALETSIPFIMGGYHGAAAEVGPFVLPYQTACLNCYLVGIEAVDDEIPELAWIDRAWLRHPNVHFVTALAAHLICSEIFKRLTGLGEPATYNHFASLDLEEFTLTTTAFERSKHCTSCGSEKPVTLSIEAQPI